MTFFQMIDLNHDRALNLKSKRELERRDKRVKIEVSYVDVGDNFWETEKCNVTNNKQKAGQVIM